jgi:glycosyltransferase involved in cell wall biosynthesis
VSKTDTIHQFTPSMEVGDSVSNGVLYIQRLLRELGFISEIFVHRRDLNINLKHNIHHISEYIPNENNLLFYHHSIGHGGHDEIMSFADKKVLIYHNITPSHFFKGNSHIQALCDLGREQLRVSAHNFISSFGDSDYNCDELRYYNYPDPKTLTLLLDFQKQAQFEPNQELIQRYISTYNMIFVGRVVSNKMQHQLIDLAYALKNMGMKNFKIHIIGGASEPKYMKFLKSYSKDLGLSKEINITGKVSDEDLTSYYHLADLYISISEHEGFGMPLVEAMKYDIPVLAYNAGGTATTIPKEGLLEKKAPSYVAKQIFKLQQDPYFRVDLVKKQKEKLDSFSYENTKKKLIDYLNHLDIGIEIAYSDLNVKKSKYAYQIEGPFDSTYSLAIVNKNIALALNENHELNDVKLFSTEGGGDFEPNLDNLNEKVENLYTKKLDNIDITLRCLYPPRTNAMKGYQKIVGPYGWEESKFPNQYVDWFNTKSTMVFAMSDYVKDVLKDNGVYLPVVTTGVVVEDILDINSNKLSFELPAGFKLLHISSAFDRKGIDILLDAFDNIEDNDISLVLKTFPNPHNKVIEQLDNLGYKIIKEYEQSVYLYAKDKKNILLINKDIPQEQIKYLYENSDAFVAPSFGEGFGMPHAEAMLLDLPVITTGYGGHTDFCTDETSYLVDFDFAYAKTHMNLKNSLWTVPKTDALKEKILEVKSSIDLEKTKKAKAFILKNYSSNQVANKITDAIKRYPSKKPEQNIALFSTYNTKCGIALYSKYLISTFEDKVTIFANETNVLTDSDEDNIIRCWRDSRETEDIDKLKRNLLDKKITNLIIQYNFSFLPLNLLGELLEFCYEKGIKTYLFLHSTKDVVTDTYKDSFSFISDQMNKATKVYVHTINDMNYLKEFGIFKNTSLFTHAINVPKNLTNSVTKNKIPILATFGFLLPQKGVFELIDVAQKLHNEGQKVKLLLLCSIHPASISKQLASKLKDKIAKSTIKEYITLDTRYLKESEIISRLSKADKILYLYSNTQESSSAAVRMGLLAKKEVITTPLKIFDDVRDIVTKTKDNSIDEIVKTLKASLQNSYNVKKHQNFLEENSWEIVSKNFYNSLKG